MSFEFASAGRVVFGAGRAREAGVLARELGGRRALVVTGRSAGRAGPVLDSLRQAGLAAEGFAVAGEPTLDAVRQATAAAVAHGADVVLGVGGGSALDAAKAVAALAASRTDPLDHLEVVGCGQPLPCPALPVIAVPTTAGTGSEVTRNAVLLSPGHRVKASLRSPHLLPRVALVDPELLPGAPPAVTAAAGLDALSQLVEPFLSARAQPLTDALAREGLPRSARSLRRACLEASPPAAVWEDLALASLFGGLCLANAGLGAVHGFAAPIGGMFGAPHGAVCAALLPAALEANERALRERAPSHPALPRLAEVARLLTGDAGAEAADGVRWLRQLLADLGVPGLSAHGLTPACVAEVVPAARAASSMRGNPVALTDEELSSVLLASL